MDSSTLHLLTTFDEVKLTLRELTSALNNAPIKNNEAECADQLRSIVKSFFLPYTTLSKEPELLLEASKNVGRNENNGALWTRFTVQYNLFAGSIVALGSEKQRDHLYSLQKDGALGCFAFTECGAGVLSGAVCETIATYSPKTKTFKINSPTESSVKKWISQGMYAEYAVILANVLLEENGKNVGPHLFFTRIQVPYITLRYIVHSMYLKTCMS